MLTLNKTQENEEGNMDRDRYYVIPAKYIKLVSRTQKKQFSELLGVVTNIRAALGKEVNPGYYVCKHDEPYAESVRDMIEDGEEAKERILSGENIDIDWDSLKQAFIDGVATTLPDEFDEEIEFFTQEESMDNEIASAKREEIQRHVERMEELNQIGKKIVR